MTQKQSGDGIERVSSIKETSKKHRLKKGKKKD